MRIKLTIPIILLVFSFILFHATISKAGTVVINLHDLKNKKETIKVTGSGFYLDNPKFSLARKKKLAERAAVLDGYRKLLERINEVIVDSETTIKNYIIENDSIKVKVNGIVRGAKYVTVRHSNKGSVEVDMEITLGKEFCVFFQPYVKSQNLRRNK